jgi:precorrin-8X/cobalt-precorrin-8 methylmutase
LRARVRGDEATGLTAMTTTSYDYIRDPEEIYRRSFAAIRAEADLGDIPPDLETVVVRLIHACGMPDIVRDLAFSIDAASRARRALGRGASILVDTEMVADGIIRSRLTTNRVLCTLGREEVRERALREATTRSAAAVELWLPDLEGAVVAIGNAPTALFRLLELIDLGVPQPAVVLAFPVGFVGAAESKDALAGHPAAIPFVTVRGRRGGSAMAAAAVNALAGAPR